MKTKEIFQDQAEARRFIERSSNDWLPVKSRILFTIDDELINEETYDFLDVKNSTEHYFQLLQYKDHFEVHHFSIKPNGLVRACEENDINEVLVQIQKQHSDKAIILAFKKAIFNDNVDIVKLFIENELVNDIMMGKESPLRTCSIHDSVRCYFYLIEHFEIKEDTLAQLLWNNGLNIFKKVVADEETKNKILSKEQRQNSWVYRLLQKHANETISLYKSIYPSV